MSHITKHHKQTMVYWGNPADDGYGGLTFDLPVEIKGRWEDKQKLFINANGKQSVSRAIVFLGQDVDLRGYLYLGELSDLSSAQESDPANITNAFEIQAFGKIPNHRGTKFERKAWLSTYDF